MRYKSSSWWFSNPWFNSLNQGRHGFCPNAHCNDQFSGICSFKPLRPFKSRSCSKSSISLSTKYNIPSLFSVKSQHTEKWEDVQILHWWQPHAPVLCHHCYWWIKGQSHQQAWKFTEKAASQLERCFKGVTSWENSKTLYRWQRPQKRYAEVNYKSSGKREDWHWCSRSGMSLS